MKGDDELSSDLLRQLFNSETPITDFEDTLSEIEQSAIFSQAYVLLARQGKLKKAPAYFQLILEEKYQIGLYQNIFIKSQTDQVFQLFEEEKIDVIPLKGTTFAEKYFDHIGARPTSDIDLLVRERDIEKAEQAVKNIGYTIEETRIPFHFHSSFSKAIPGSEIPLTVELHWNIIKENTSNFKINELWDNSSAIMGYQHVRELSDVHTFYLICLHGWRHNLDSWKYFIDIIQLLYKLGDKIDYEELVKITARHQTKKRMIRTLSIVYEEYPELTQILPFPYKMPIIKNREATLNKYIDFIDYSFLSYDSPKHSLIEFYHWLHPKY